MSPQSNAPSVFVVKGTEPALVDRGVDQTSRRAHLAGRPAR